MIEPSTDDPEQFWAEVLSDDPARVRTALRSLPRDELAGVRAHLRLMAEGAGWSPGQQRRARAALDVMRGSLPD